jgi:multicomponent Na+:H+ antiporter subunit F
VFLSSRVYEVLSEINMMQILLLISATLLMLTIIGGLVRVMWGPTSADRMLAAQLFGTTGVGILLLLSQAWNTPYLQNVALIFALLAAIMGVAFVRRGWLLDRTK